MRIGVFLGDYKPQDGGGYTFTSDIADAFFELAGQSRHEFILLCNTEYSASLTEQKLSQNIRLFSIPNRGILGWLISALKHHSPVFSQLWRWPCSLERSSLKQQIQMMWFVGGYIYDTLNIPYVATVWDIQHRIHPWFPEVSTDGRWEYREAMHSRYLRRATYIITGTDIGREQLGWYYQIPADRVKVLPQPTPNWTKRKDTSEIGPKVSILSDRKFIIYPAQFWPHKNHFGLLHSIKILRDSYGIELDLVLTGSNKGNKGYVKKLVEEFGLSSKVHMMGFVSLDELAWLYRHALALVYPTYTGPDNLPPLEAFSFGCPVLISDYPGAREQLNDAALYFDPRLPSSIAACLEQLINDHSLQEELVRKGKLRSEKWTSSDFVRGVVSIFDEFEAVRCCWP